MTPRRPIMRYHGGKWRLATWIIQHLPPHRVYVEPFGGAASVLLRKPRSFAEVYNDLDDDVVNLFRVLQRPADALELKRLCELTPFARSEFDVAYEDAGSDHIERARRILIRSWMGHGASGVRKHRTGFRVNPHRQRTTAADDWQNWPEAIPVFIARLRSVTIEKRPAAKLIADHDTPQTLFYVDPPYMFGVRSQKRKGGDLYHGYKHELTDAQHAELLAQLRAVVGMVVLSGYASELYETRLHGWHRIEHETTADRGGARTEVIWINPAAAAAGRLPLEGAA